MIDLIREWLELWAKQYWLKHIDKAINRYNKLNTKTKAQAYVVHMLVQRYNEIYGEEIVCREFPRKEDLPCTRL